MTMGGQRQAPRLAKPSWKDPRLLIGILLVLASVAGVVALVDSAGTSVPMYVAKDALTVGQKITPDDLTIVKVQLGDVDGRYLSPRDALDTNAVAVRMVPQGELVSRSSIGRVDALNRKPASVTLEEALPPDIVVGARVDVWVSLPDDRNGFKPPTLMLPGVEVAGLNAASSSLGGSRNTQLLVLVTDSQMPGFLGAVANKAKVSVVWNPGAGS